MEWLDRLAEALGEEPISVQEAERLLRTSREVAHRVERTATPLAAFLVGAAVGRRIERGDTRETAFDESLDAVLVRLPEPHEPEAGERAPREDG